MKLHVPFALLVSGLPLLAQGLPGMAVGILQQTSLARDAVKAHAKDAAADHIRQAEALVKQIREQSGSTGQPLLVPVAWETETTTTYTNVKRPKGSDTSADRLMKHNTNVSAVEQDTTAAKLNVDTAAERLAKADSLISLGDWEGADAALSAVLAAVDRERASTDMPLLRARQNLMLARSRVLDQKYADAKLPLREAADALSSFAALFPGPRAETAKTIREDILAYAQEIAHHHDDAVDKIDAWLDPVNQWYQALSK